MLMQILRCSVQMVEIAKREKEKLTKKPQDAGAEINSVHSYVIYIVTWTSSFRLCNSNKFGQMQWLTNDNYSDIKLYSIWI